MTTEPEPERQIEITLKDSPRKEDLAQATSPARLVLDRFRKAS